jgi:hypothetical protein
MERTLLNQHTFERSNVFNSTATPVSYSKKTLATERMQCRNITLLPCQPMVGGKHSMKHHCRSKKGVVPIDVELLNHIVMTPNFLEYLLEKTEGLRDDKEVMIIATGSTLMEQGVPVVCFIQFKLGENEAKFGTIDTAFWGKLPRVQVYELAYLVPQEAQYQSVA